MSDTMNLVPVQIIIGRNTMDGTPLEAAAWGRFQARIIYELGLFQGEFYRIIPGTGIDITNKIEENVTILGSWKDGMEVTLDELLQDLRVEFNQAVILLIWGELEMIA